MRFLLQFFDLGKNFLVGSHVLTPSDVGTREIGMADGNK
jgi:hypothetical protein